MVSSEVLEAVEGGSDWASPPVLKEKLIGRICRICHYKANKVINAYLKDSFDVPNINQKLEKLKNAKILRQLKLKDAYLQVVLSSASQTISKTTTPCGLYQFKLLLQEIKTTLAIFQDFLRKIWGRHYSAR